MAETNDAIIDEQFVDINVDDYVLQTVTVDNIISELNLSEDDAAITKSIICSLEHEASVAIKSNIIASLPYVGNIQKKIIKDRIKEHYKELQEVRASVSKEEYKQYVKDLRKQIRNDIVSEYNNRRVYNKFRNGYKKEYEKLVLSRGKAYADMYIQALFLLKVVPYDDDVQYQCDVIAGRIKE